MFKYVFTLLKELSLQYLMNHISIQRKLVYKSSYILITMRIFNLFIQFKLDCLEF